jgi:hypothetical protein
MGSVTFAGQCEGAIEIDAEARDMRELSISPQL